MLTDFQADSGSEAQTQDAEIPLKRSTNSALRFEWPAWPPGSEKRELGLRVMSGALELNKHSRIVAEGPRVVTGGDSVNVAGGEVCFVSVLVLYVQGPRYHVADVLDLTAVGFDNGLYAFGPAPTGLEGVAPDLATRELDELHRRLVWGPCLVG